MLGKLLNVLQAEGPSHLIAAGLDHDLQLVVLSLEERSRGEGINWGVDQWEI